MVTASSTSSPGSGTPLPSGGETIRVKGGVSEVEQIVTTGHGPIINSLAPDHAGEQPLALKWTAHEPNAMVEVLFDMNRAQSCAQMRDVLRGWHTPVQNVVYADVHGTIAHSYPGRIPSVRPATGAPRYRDGPGSTSGRIDPVRRLPQQQNPPSGYLATANNRVVDDRYPYWLGADFSPATGRCASWRCWSSQSLSTSQPFARCSSTRCRRRPG